MEVQEAAGRAPSLWVFRTMKLLIFGPTTLQNHEGGYCVTFEQISARGKSLHATEDTAVYSDDKGNF